MAGIVCLDTMVLIWGVKKEATPGQEIMIRHAETFLSELDSQKVQVLIPSVVVAELLVRVPEEKNGTVAAFFNDHFMIMPFDMPAAVASARLWRKMESTGKLKELKESGTDRREIKADIQIAAIAWVHGADCIYSSDPHLKQIAEGVIPVKNMPQHYQPELFPK